MLRFAGAPNFTVKLRDGACIHLKSQVAENIGVARGTKRTICSPSRFSNKIQIEIKIYFKLKCAEIPLVLWLKKVTVS